MVTTDAASPFEGWSILELMGHRRLAGWLSETAIGGGTFLRIDIPCEPPATQFYAPSAVYAITPTDEAAAKLVAKGSAPAPVARWELPSESAEAIYDTDDEDDPDEDSIPF